MKLRCRLNFHDFTMWGSQEKKRIQTTPTVFGMKMEPTERDLLIQKRTCKDCNFIELRTLTITGRVYNGATI